MQNYSAKPKIKSKKAKVVKSKFEKRRKGISHFVVQFGHLRFGI